ncbi:hypothetical protein AMAG_17615 [Allomyces macrogynus ATCC 38327]|uniref:Serine/threonine-protein kinase TOR n=1 Tax=Allomyces macrogynus (strain ATCC 38327) TaxID=578462 RepID=A0A0L0RVG7_ALLM3|nr:hypothetical protein AMAG_17615 [Allomyces macrogynus ATCC 38327]|eukprot:KNE54070.1 hypothetical protein AMAG_17615 [Allomyces macrogynus ATCC 38327]
MASYEALDHIIARLWSRNDELKAIAAEDLKQHVLAVSRELASDVLDNFLTDVSKRIFELILGSEVNEKVGGIMAIEKLIEVDGEENATKITRYGNYLTMAFNNGDPQVMVLAARALGKLVSPRIGGAFTAEFVESEVKKAIDTLHLGEKHDGKNHGAVLVLKELAQNAPTLICAHVPTILESLWNPLRESKLVVREAAAEAMSVCLELSYQRETPSRTMPWFSKVTDEAMKSLKAPQVEHVHGALLVVREFEICELLLKLKDHKDALIWRTVISVIPTAASFNPPRFLSHLITQLKRERDRSAALIAVGRVALAMESSMKDCLEDIIKVSRESLLMKAKSRNEAPAYQCVSMLATAVGQALTKDLQDVLDLFFANGISQPLVQALGDISTNIPPLLPKLQERLLNLVSLILSNQPFRPPGSPARTFVSAVTSMGGTSSEARQTESIVLALQTVGTFEFGQSLNEFVSQIVTKYLEDDVADVRLAAALTCCRVLSSDPVRFQTSAHALGQITSSTGYVIQPYLDHPTLLDTTISLLKTESSPPVRQETMKLLGTLGALDPYKHKQINRQVTDAVQGDGNTIDPATMLTMGMGPSHEDYYPSVAIAALMKMCRDFALATHHTAAIKAVMYICKTLGLKCVPFLPQIMPPFLGMLKTSQPPMLEFFFQEMAQLVQVVGAHMTS